MSERNSTPSPISGSASDSDDTASDDLTADLDLAFDAGQHQRRWRRRRRGFWATRAHVNALIAASRPDIRARAHWLVRNNGYAVKVVESWAANTVGNGIKPILGLRRLRQKRNCNGALHPAPICAELCDVGARMQEAERDALRILGRRDARGNRQLRVGLGNSMPGIAIVANLLANHPGLNVSVESGSHQTILAPVLQHRVDVAVLPDVPSDSRFRRFPVLSQDVVAIVSADVPEPPGGSFSLAQLMDRPMIFRPRGSSTQKVVDRAFRQAGLEPTPRLVADTRDAVYEVVALGIGVGFMWRFGTYRRDSVRRIAVLDMATPVDEVVFTLATERNDLVDMFLNASRVFAKTHAETV